MSALRLAAVTPARDERENLERLAAAMLAQDARPARWVICDDGSGDGTFELASELAAAHPWITVVRRSAEEESLAQGRRTGRDLIAFRRGVASLEEPFDVVVKLDADVSFAPDYLGALLARFAADPRLGIASGVCCEQEGEEWVARTKIEGSVWGASRAYRWACLSTLEGLEDVPGWDGLDELRAQLDGYATASFADLRFRHHRPEGGRERGRLHHGAFMGRASWYMGYRPSYLVLRAVFRAREEPTALAMVYGYAAAALRRAPRCPDRQAVHRLREQQRLRTALRHARPV